MEIKQPKEGEIVLAVSNGDGSYQMLAMNKNQAYLINLLIASVTSDTEPLVKSTIKLIQEI